MEGTLEEVEEVMERRMKEEKEEGEEIKWRRKRRRSNKDDCCKVEVSHDHKKTFSWGKYIAVKIRIKTRTLKF